MKLISMWGVMSRGTIFISIIVYIVLPAIFLTYLNVRESKPQLEDSKNYEIIKDFNTFINMNVSSLEKAYGGKIDSCFETKMHETIVLIDQPPYWVTFIFCTEPRLNKDTPNFHELSFVSIEGWKVLLSDGHLFKSQDYLNDIPEVEVNIKKIFGWVEDIEYLNHASKSLKE